MHGEFAGQWVAEALQKLQILIGVIERNSQRGEQRRDEQTTDATVQFLPIGTEVITLGKRVSERRVSNRVEEPGQHFTVVGDHISVVKRDRSGSTGGEVVPHAVPDVSSLARLVRRDAQRIEFVVDLTQPRTVVPQEPVPLRQSTEELLRMVELILVCTIDPDDDLAQVRHFAEFVDDVL